MPRLGGGDIITGAVTINTVNYEPKTPGEITLPTEIDMPWDVKIIDTGREAKLLSPTIDMLKPVGKTYYVDPYIGLDTNDGLSWASPLLTLQAAAAKEDVVVVRCKAGIYANNSTLPVDKTISFICDDGVADLAYGVLGSSRTWTDKTGYWSNTMSGSPLDVFSFPQKINGEYHWYASVATEAEVASTPYSFTKVDGVVYVNTGGAAPGANIFIRTSIACSISSVITAPRTYSFDGFCFIGGMAANMATHLLTLLLTNCEFKRCKTANGLGVTGNVHVICKNCNAHDNVFDGFNYHGNETYSPKFIEIDCNGYDNGVTSETNINNGSTSHESAIGIRLNGQYFNNKGPNVADVGEAHTLNCYCKMSASTATFIPTDFRIASLEDETCDCWLYRCTANAASELNIMNYAPTTATIYVYDCLMPKQSSGVEVWTPE